MALTWDRLPHGGDPTMTPYRDPLCYVRTPHDPSVSQEAGPHRHRIGGRLGRGLAASSTVGNKLLLFISPPPHPPNPAVCHGGSNRRGHLPAHSVGPAVSSHPNQMKLLQKRKLQARSSYVRAGAGSERECIESSSTA